MTRERTFRGVLLDIEGTTTPISFVYDVLFPFARERLNEACAEACAEASASAELSAAVAKLRREYEQEVALGDVPEFGSGAPYASYLMDQDRKSGGLKRLQGLIWRAGYESGALRGEVFADVPQALARWQRAGLRIRIYSSGSILAQKLLFQSTEYGDLTSCFEGHHDTTSGAKKEAASYRRIAEEFALPTAEILFLSDVLAELDAAAQAGMTSGLLQRPGNQPVPAAHGYPVFSDFQAVAPLLLR